MKKLFYFGLLGLAILEILKVYLIMPMPGSQRMDSIDIAYFIHTYRWYFRGIFTLMIIVGGLQAFNVRRWWLPIIPALFVGVIVYYFNFEMTAEKIFLEPQKKLSFRSRTGNILGDTALVIGVINNGQAKAYPVRYIAYHHQVRDTVGGKQVMVTYCTVCRTGRVFEPLVNGVHEDFRLVGMDHFNAMFEDASTKSWWRQATGEAVAGPLTGSVLPELESIQLSANKFFWLYPFGVIMDADEPSIASYDSLARYERGKSKGDLTKRDTLSWKDKSWVVGVQHGTGTKAYDWNKLVEERIINDNINDTPIVLALSDDEQSFIVFRRPSHSEIFSIQNDTLRSANGGYDFSGKHLEVDSLSLRRVNAYQEYWHSWKTFHPNTEVYD
jgi:hypothetical protein